MRLRFLFARLPPTGYLREQLLEVGADQSRDFVSVEQVKVPFRVGVVVNNPVGISVKGAGALTRVHRDALGKRSRQGKIKSDGHIDKRLHAVFSILKVLFFVFFSTGNITS